MLALVGCGSDNSTAGGKTVSEVLSNASKDKSSKPEARTTTSALDDPQSTPAEKTYDKIDADLTAMSETMAYAEATNMLEHPDNYMGKVVKAKGVFAVSNDNGNTYFACLVTDSTACCSQPFEFVLADTTRAYPAGYPALDSEITVVGVFGTYNEGANTYCRLSDAQLL